MRGLSDFHLGADVVAGDGRKVGTLVRIVVEEKGFDPRALVVKEGESFGGRLQAAESIFITDEVVIPIAAVESVDHDLVRLSMSAPDVRRQPPYLSHHFRPLTVENAALKGADVLTGGIGIPNVEETAAKDKGQIEIDGGENGMLGKTRHPLCPGPDPPFAPGGIRGVRGKPPGVL